MRNILVFVLAMTIVLSEKMLFNPMPTGAVTPSDVGIAKTEKLASLDSNQNNAVEKDGIRFEILVPERTWVIPPNQPDARTPVQIGIRITNNTQMPIRFGRFDPLMVLIMDIVGPDGLTLERFAARDILLKSQKLACLLTTPGKSLTFFMDANLYWQDNKLLLGGVDGLGGWNFSDLKPGNYQVRFKYISSSSREICYEAETTNPQTSVPKVVDGLWTGFIVTPFVPVHLIER